MAKNLPNGSRIYVKPKIGGKVRPCRVKVGTASLLGLSAQQIEAGKNGRGIKRGAKGTKSFTLFLASRTTVGGAPVVSLDFPVPGDVKVLEFYKWAKGFGKVAGIRTPDGMSYYWKKAAGQKGGSSGGNGGLPGPLGGFDAGDLGDLVEGARDIFGGQPLIPGLLETAAKVLLD